MKKILSKTERLTKKVKELESESYEIISELIREFGEDKGNIIVINLEDNENSLYVMEYNGLDGCYVGRDIISIVLSKEDGGIILNYGEDYYEYIKYNDVLLSDKIYIINQLISIVCSLENNF